MRKSSSIFILLIWSFLALRGMAGTVLQFQIYYSVFNPPAEVDVEMYDQDKPVTVRNFLRLVEANAFHNSFFHRCQPGFVLQGGGYAAINPDSGGAIAPPYANLVNVGNFGNITNEFKVGNFHSNTFGTIAMAKTADPNSANSQFFFNLADNSGALDNTNNAGGFTVFGHAISGLPVLNFFTFFNPGNVVNLTNSYGPGGALFTQLPSAITGTNPPPYDALIYFTVSPLLVQASIGTNGVPQVTWNSLGGLTNIVEYTTSLQSSWHVLVSTNGTGGLITVPDTNASSTRFYRVHILY